MTVKNKSALWQELLVFQPDAALVKTEEFPALPPIDYGK